jgi:hypothetical protein
VLGIEKRAAMLKLLMRQFLTQRLVFLSEVYTCQSGMPIASSPKCCALGSTPNQAAAPGYAHSHNAERTSLVVRVFGRRRGKAIHAAKQPATEKRQGTKSREVVHLRGSGLYGDLSRALVLEIE